VKGLGILQPSFFYLSIPMADDFHSGHVGKKEEGMKARRFEGAPSIDIIQRV
jgi:hypothetical protein